MTALFDIRAALRTQLLKVGTIPAAANRAWENKKFKPTGKTAWIRETFNPTSERLVGSGTVEILGMIQFDLFYPADDGTKNVETVADAIKAAFAPGTKLGGIVNCYRSERAQGQPDGEWFMVPVTIYWRAHTIT